MEHFVTLFDRFFLPQGLALHLSIQRHIKDFTLWVLCMDDETHRILSQLSLPGTKLLHLTNLETTELLQVKPTRSNREYCWTLTPFAPRFVFEADPTVSRVTYVDADIWFCKNPAAIFQELEQANKHVLITDHAYAPEYDQSATAGQYCVQFITFDRVGGEVVRKWWEERCLEWCYAEYEDGKLGDQKYLDDWPIRFSEQVHVLRNKELTLAPWNAMRFPYGNAVIFHFQGLRLTSKNSAITTNLPLPRPVVDYIYKPYISDLKTVITILEKAGAELPVQVHKPTLYTKCYQLTSLLYRWVQSIALYGHIRW